MVSAGAIAAVCAASSALACSAAVRALMRWPMTSSMTPTMMNGIFGMPGMNAMASAATPAMVIATRDWVSWVDAVEPRSDSAFERVTIMPVETAISSAGIWVTRPSPMVRMPYF